MLGLSVCPVFCCGLLLERCIAWAVCVCASVCCSRAWVVLKWLNRSRCKKFVFRVVSVAHLELFCVGCCYSGRPLSSSGSRSSSASSQASLSSLSSSGESEHLYRDIASDISSASSPAASPVRAVSDKPKRGESAPSVMSQYSRRHLGYVDCLGPDLWNILCLIITHMHTHPFNGPLSGTTRVGQYQKGKTSLDFTQAKDSGWQWHQLGHMQLCTSLQTDNHASTQPLSFYRPHALPAVQPTASEHWRHVLS